MITREQFVKRYYPYVSQIARGTGLFPELILSVAILESSGKINGQYYPAQSALAISGNNLFGIKADSSWKGDTITMKTGEYYNGVRVTIPGIFRKYATPEESFADYIYFLQTNPRYAQAGVFTADTITAQAEALKKAGYATDPNYTNLIVSVSKSITKYLPYAIGASTVVIAAAVIYYLFK